jgi:hypothetical protein
MVRICSVESGSFRLKNEKGPTGIRRSHRAVDWMRLAKNKEKSGMPDPLFVCAQVNNPNIAQKRT